MGQDDVWRERQRVPVPRPAGWARCPETSATPDPLLASRHECSSVQVEEQPGGGLAAHVERLPGDRRCCAEWGRPARGPRRTARPAAGGTWPCGSSAAGCCTPPGASGVFRAASAAPGPSCGREGDTPAQRHLPSALPVARFKASLPRERRPGPVSWGSPRYSCRSSWERCQSNLPDSPAGRDFPLNPRTAEPPNALGSRPLPPARCCLPAVLFQRGGCGGGRRLV
jgi:hypothetical protein